MRKYLYAFIGCCVIQSVFAEQPSGVYQNQHISSILIPRIILQNVLIQDDLISQTPGAVEKMMAKYDKLAGPLGQEPLTVNDITQICVESDVITKKEDCLNRVFNPVLAEMGKVRFINTCSGKITGGNNHCIDDVFVEGKKQNGNQYHQDVNVNPYAANGFAIEYAKKKGHDVWCSSEVKDSTVLCTTLDNKEFYSVKFKGTNNTTDSTIEKNLVKGICALTNTKYIDKGFHGIKSDGSMGLDVDIESSQGCLMKCDLELISKFALTGKTEQRKFNDIDDKYHDFCSMHIVEHLTTTLNRYPGYEYMTDAFKNIQVVLDSKLVDVLKSYVKIQGINVSSFECDYSSKKYDTSATYLGDMLNISMDDVLDCRINGTPVSFVFDDLYEPKEWEQNAGQAAMQCVLVGGRFDSDKTCRGIDRDVCLSDEVKAKVPGGTRWDNGVCLLNNAEKARNISNAVQLSSGILITIGVTVATGGSALVALVALGVATDLAVIGLEQLDILKPSKRAYEFATDASNCEIPLGYAESSYSPPQVYSAKDIKTGDTSIGTTVCTISQATCAYNVINKHTARLEEILEDLNPEQLSLVDDLWSNLASCVSQDQLERAISSSTLTTKDKITNNASMFLLVGNILISPEKLVQKMGKLPKFTKFLATRKIKILTSTDDVMNSGIKYSRINIANTEGIDDINNLTKRLKDKSYFYHFNIDKQTGEQFLMVADRNVFGLLDRLDNNFYLSREGAHVSNNVFSQSETNRIISDMAKEDLFPDFHVIAMPTVGSGGEKEMYRIVAMSDSDAKALGYINNNGHLEQFVPEAAQRIANAPSKVGTNNVLTYIHGKPVYIESIEDIGRHGDRAIILVKCGDYKLPFYISTGTAGKTEVVTGKWEIFGGLEFNGYNEFGAPQYWFVKGRIKDINGHYGSSELEQIAHALDSQIGDLRDTEYVLETIGRHSMPNNAGGIVGGIDSGLPELDIQRINNYGALGLGKRGSLDNIVRYISSF